MIFVLKLLFLFCIGNLLGWSLEVIFRRIVHKKWINPGFLTGPSLPLYGFSLCALYLLAQINVSFIPYPIVAKIVLFVIMAIAITIVEYFAGLIFIKGMHIKLWDYSDQWGNIQGIICPLFTFFWWLLSAFYYFIIHPRIINSLDWLDDHIAFSFVIGFYYGIFFLDMIHSFKLVTKLKKFAKEKQIVIKLENFRELINNKRFMEPIHSKIEFLPEVMVKYIEFEREKIEQKKIRIEAKAKTRARKIEKSIQKKIKK